MYRIVIVSAIALLLKLTVLSSSASAHQVFKKELEKQYSSMKVSCNACHVKGKPKTERGEFGKLFQKQLEGQNISATWKDKKGDERKEFEKKTMIPAFKKALEKVKEMKNKDDETYDDLIKSGKIPEITEKSKEPKG